MEKKFFLSLFITTFLCSMLFVGLNGAFAGTTTRVSVASDGTEADDNSYDPSLSLNGRYVAFYSYASNLVADDTNGHTDVFVHECQTPVSFPWVLFYPAFIRKK